MPVTRDTNVIAARNAQDSFFDRVPQAVALSNSLTIHMRRVRGDEIDGEQNLNITSYFGMGGIGKTELSERLERWLHDADDRARAVWGSPPIPQHDLATARWNLHGIQDNLDVIPLLTALRQAFGSYKSSWPAFDLAFAAYLNAARPSQEHAVLSGANGGEVERGMLQSLADLAQDFHLPGFTASLAQGAVSTLVRALMKQRHASRAVRAYPGLPELPRRCAEEVTSANQSPSVAAHLCFALTSEFEQIPPGKRPAVVVFIDAFEHVQGSGHREGERALNRLIGQLPYTFFVVTGRDRLDWNRDDRQLEHRGAFTWPGLGEGVVEDPRQHLIGNLSQHDAIAFLRHERERFGLDIPDPVIAGLVSDRGGWPVHLDALVSYAVSRNRSHPGHRFTASDLGGGFADIVSRLLADLPEDERQLLRAACVLPFFDARLLNAIALQTGGAASRLEARTLVADNPGNTYPYRVHDKVREQVRAVGPDVRGGWSTGDWTAAAVRAAAEAERRYDAAREAGADLEQLHSVALGIWIATEHGVGSEWLAKAIRLAPNIASLALLIPAKERAQSPDARALIEFIELMAAPASVAVAERLQVIGASGYPISGSAALWSAYRFRRVNLLERSLTQLEWILEQEFISFQWKVVRRQIALTHVFARRFEEARRLVDALPEPARGATLGVLRRTLGVDENAIRDLEEQRDRQTSRRYQLEVSGTLLVWKALAGRLDNHEIESLRSAALDVGHMTALRSVAHADAYVNLARGSRVREIVGWLDASVPAVEAAGSPLALEIVALRTLFDGADPEDSVLFEQLWTRAASLTRRKSAWLRAEAYCAELGRPLPEIAAQWPEGHDEGTVFARWQDVGRRVRARAEATDVSW